MHVYWYSAYQSRTSGLPDLKDNVMKMKTVAALLLPLNSGMVSFLPHSRGVFLNAVSDPELQPFQNNLTCVQTQRSDFLALERAGYTVTTELPEAGSQDYVLCALPKQKQQAQANMACGLELLKPGGVLICAARNDAGASSLAKMAKAIGCTSQMSKYHHKVFWMEKSQDGEVAVVKNWLTEVGLRHVPAIDAVSSPAVFGWDKVDKGSELLASTFDESLVGHVADFGAGWGYLSRELLTRCPGVQHLSVIEAEAVALKAAQNNLERFSDTCVVEYLWRDVVSEALPVKLDCIITNPPFHSGKDADMDLGPAFIRAAKKALKPKGRLLLVANRHLPYEAVIAECFKTRRVLVENNAFKVIEAR